VERLRNIDSAMILDSLGDGVYVTDTDRKIVYWNQSAERITGWPSEDILGRGCFDDVLCHVDKDGHHLCGEDRCPLHRSMVTGIRGELPLVFARRKDDRRVPVQVTVAPIRDDAGRIVGGVEVFRDISAGLRELEQAQAIQTISLEHELPDDERIRFATHYLPHDIVGGDYFGIRRLGADQYGVFLADVMGHGVAAALYTMHLSSLWDRYHPRLAGPAEFAAKLNAELSRVVARGESFAAGMCGLVDVAGRTFRFAGAGNPTALVFRADGAVERLPCEGLPFGLMEDASYHETVAAFHPGDKLLLFTDGAVEVCNAAGEMLGVEGLIRILAAQGYPAASLRMDALEQELLAYSNTIRLEDDLTVIEARCLS
jgi:phosphoserine phosphatase RsbU/P